MLLNRHNLEITKFAGSDEYQTFKLDTLHVGSKGTTATDGFVLIHVSKLPEQTKSKPVEPFLLDAATLSEFDPKLLGETFNETTLSMFDASEGKVLIDPESNIYSKIPKAVVNVRASLLLRAALSALMFAEGKDASLQLEVFGKDEPIKLETTNEQTGQRWLALTMSSKDKNIVDVILKNKPKQTVEEFKADAEVVDEFQAAIRAAELLG